MIFKKAFLSSRRWLLGNRRQNRSQAGSALLRIAERNEPHLLHASKHFEHTNITRKSKAPSSVSAVCEVGFYCSVAFISYYLGYFILTDRRWPSIRNYGGLCRVCPDVLNF